MAGNRIKGLTIEIDGNTSKLQNSLRDVNKTIKNTQSELRDVNKLLKLDPGNTELLQQKQKLLTEAINATKEKLDQEKLALEQLASQDSTPEVVKQQELLQREIVETQAELDKLVKEGMEAGSVLGSQFQAAGEKIQEVGGKVTALGEGLTKNVTAPLTAIGAASVVAWNELDDGMDTVAKKTGATGDALEDLQDTAKDVYGSMAVNAEEAGTAIGEVNTRFKVTGDTLEDVSKQFIRFAKVNDTDLNSAIDTTDALMKKYNKDIKDLDGVLGLLTKAGQDTGISMSSLMGTLKTNGASLQELGFGLEESVNLLAMMEANGVEASTALTGLKKAVTNAASDGLSADDALKQTIASIKDAKTETEALQIATETFGSRGAAEMANAIRSGRLDIDNLSTSLKDYQGVVSTTYDTIQDVPDEAVIALNNLKMVGAELAQTGFEALAPVLEEVVQALKDFNEWFKNLDDGTKEMIVKIAAVAAALGPLLVIIGHVITAVGTIASAIGSLMPVLSTIGTVIGTIASAIGGALLAAIGLVIAAIAIWIKNWEYIKEIPGGIRDLFIIAVDAIMDKATEVGELVYTKFLEIRERAGQIFNEVKEIIKGVFISIGQLAYTWGGDLIANLAEGIRSKISAITSAIKSVADVIASYIHFSEPDVGPLSHLHTFMPDMLDELAKGIKQNLTVLDNPMTQLANAMMPQQIEIAGVNALSSQVGALGTAVSNINTNPVVNISLEGDAAGLFNAVRSQNNSFKRSTGRSAF